MKSTACIAWYKSQIISMQKFITIHKLHRSSLLGIFANKILKMNTSLTLTVLVVTVLIAVANASPQSNNRAMQNANRGLDSARFKPNWNVQGGGSGNNGRNWGAGVNIGVGSKVWESHNRRHQVGVGANYGQQFGRSHGQSWRSKPDVGVGAGYRFKF